MPNINNTFDSPSLLKLNLTRIKRKKRRVIDWRYKRDVRSMRQIMTTVLPFVVCCGETSLSYMLILIGDFLP